MSSFIRSKEMARAQNVEMGHVTLTTPTWEISSHHKANTSRGHATSLRNLKSLTLAIPEIFQGVQKF